MPLAIVYSRASNGMDAPLVTVEVHLSYGTVALNIVGLPEAAVKESKDRVRSAIMNSKFDFPIYKITINLAPADLPKEGGRFDLPIALGILLASSQLPAAIFQEYEFSGELALSGALRSVRGMLPAVMNAQRAGRKYIIPTQNSDEAGLVADATVYGAGHLLEVCEHLTGKTLLMPCVPPTTVYVPEEQLDLADVKGQPHAKRALTIAAAGKHSLLYMGPPGTGKTMLANRLPSILPPLNDEEALASAAITSISSAGFTAKAWKKIPFRAPHHTSSSVALVGGGRPPRPGEISLAHHGILFLDELPEFNRQVLESLREPLESGKITISRAAYQTVFPAHFQLIATMNPCPCGYAYSEVKVCRCSPEQVKRYLNRLSGPLLDRIDMQVEVASVSVDRLLKANALESDANHSKALSQQVAAAQKRQLLRGGMYNAHIPANAIQDICSLEANAENLLQQIMVKLALSARVYFRLLKLARTIADMEEKAVINVGHISEALTYRCLDRNKGD